MAEEQIEVSPEVIEWMFERTGKHPDQKKAPKWTLEAAKWLEGKHPTLNELIDTARRAHIPFDYLLAAEPPLPAEVPLPDMRTIGKKKSAQPSLELLETVHLCQWRQEWYKVYLHRISDAHCKFVGSASVEDSTRDVAAAMRELLRLPLMPPKGSREQRIKDLATSAEAVGVLVMRMSMLGSHHRMLDPREFSGFALADDRVPLIFTNGADGKDAQAFTFAHEFAHLMLGKTALSGSDRPTEETHQAEQWCTKVAAEFLVPTEDFLKQDDQAMGALVSRYKVSPLVILIRLKTLGSIDERAFRKRYDEEKARTAEKSKQKSFAFRDERFTRPPRYDEKAADIGVAGKFELNPFPSKDRAPIRQINEASPRFCRAVINSVREGSVTFKEAFELLKVKDTKALRAVGEKVGARL